MARPRKPVSELSTHAYTRDQLDERKAIEAASRSDVIIVPDYLAEAEREKFNQWAMFMVGMGRWNPVFSEHLARYVIAEETYEKLTVELRTALSDGDIDGASAIQRMQDRAFVQADKAARLVGMTADDLRKMPVSGESAIAEERYGGL